MPIRVEFQGQVHEFPDGTPDDAIAAALGGGPKGPDPMEGSSRLRPGQGESNEAFVERSLDAFGDATLPGLTQVGAAAGPIKQFLQRSARGLMRNALGAQEAIRKKFPTVNLEEVALREGAVPGSSRSIEAVRQSARAAGQAVNEAAASSPGRITRSVILEQLRPLHKQATMAKDPEAQQAVVTRMREIAREVGDEGLSMSEGQARKQIAAQRGKAARTSGNPKDAAFGPQMAEAERKAIAGAQRTAGGMGAALDRSQELMALEKAMTRTGNRTSLLRDALAASTGTGAGLMTGDPVNALFTIPAAVGLNRLATSPQTLGRVANVMNRSGQAPATGELQALIAQLLRGAQE